MTYNTTKINAMEDSVAMRINIGTPIEPPVIEPVSTVAAPSGIPYSNPAGTEYPVIATNDYLFPYNATEEQIQLILEGIKSCGFNASMWICKGSEIVHISWLNQISTYYRIAGLLGLKTIRILSNMPPGVKQVYTQIVPVKPDGFEYVSVDENMRRFTMKDFAYILNQNKDADNLWGYKLKDEPTYDTWCYKGIAAPVGLVDLPAVYRTYLLNSNRHIGFVTLAVSTDKNVIGKKLAGNKSLSDMEKYTAYLEAFRNKFNPSMLTVDLYPVLKDNDDKSPHYKVVSHYYPYMEVIGSFSAKHKLPFWMYMLSTQFDIYYKDTKNVRVEYPLPTKGILRFQAMTAIAYGFQGVVFWTYAAHNKENKDNGEMYHKSLIDNNGAFTEVWYNSKEVIPEIKSYGKELLNAMFQEAKHVYGTSSDSEIKNTEKLTSSIGCIIGATAQGAGFVITRLIKGRKNYVAIVSHDPFDSQAITLTIGNGYSWQEVGSPDVASEKFLGDADPSFPSGMVIQRTLKPGGMVLIRY